MGRRTSGLAGQAAALAIGSVFAQGAGLLTLVVLTRLLAKDQVGGYQQLWLIYGLLSPFLVAGIPAALLYFLPRAASDDERRAWIVEAYLTLVALGVVASAGVFLFRSEIADLLNNPSLASALAYYAPYPFFALIGAVAPSALVASGRAKLAAVANAATGVLILGLVVGAALIQPEVKALAIALSASAAASAGISVAIVASALGLRWESTRRALRWRGLMGYGIPLALTHLATKVAFQFDRVVVSAMFTPALFAVYAIGAVEIPLAVLVQQAINSVLVPGLAARHRDGDIQGMADLWQEAIRKTSLIMFPTFAFLFVMADDVIRVLYGPKFAGSVDVFRIYLLLVPMQVATYGLIPMAIGRTRINLSAAFVMLGSNAVLVLLLVHVMGILGPAVATVASTALVAGYYLLRIRGALHMPLRELFPWRILGANLAFTLAATLPALAVLLFGSPSILRLAVAGAAFLPAYTWVMRTTGRVTDDDWRRLRESIPILRERAPSI
jgi:O-antigen/teichoic acid export membrane protein